MALTERNSSALYQGLSDIIDEEAVGELLSNIPAHGTDEPATKDFVRAEVATVRSEIAELRVEIAGFDTKIAGFDAKIESVRTEIHSTANRIIIWAVGANAAMLGLVVALTRAT